MSKKYLRKNEFRFDINKTHRNRKKQAHPVYISASVGHKYKANTITHARTVNGIPTIDISENPDKFSKDKRQTRISPPFWQNKKQFSDEKLYNFRFSKKTRNQIKKINKKFR